MTAEHSREVQLRQQQTLKEMHIWSSSVFDWFDRAKVGSTLAPISALFDLLVDTHFGANRCIGRLEIWRALNGEGPELVRRFEDGFYRKLPLPKVPPPDNFIGFKSMCIRYIDDIVITFLHRIRRLFHHTDIALKLVIWPQSLRAWHIIAQHIWPLVVANVSQLSVDSHVFPRLRQFVSPSALCDCVNLRQIESDGIFPEGSADDHPNATDGQALNKWLHTPLDDGTPKLLKLEAWTGQFHEQIEQLKEAFLIASSPVNYAIRLSTHLSGSYVPFTVDNHKTLERMTFGRTDKGDTFWLLQRVSIADHQRSGEAANIGWQWTNGASVIRVQFEDRDIGPLSSSVAQ